MANSTLNSNDEESYLTPIYLAADAIVVLLIGVLNEQMISKKELAFAPLEDKLFRATVQDTMLPTSPLKDYIAKISQSSYDIPFCRQSGNSEETSCKVIDILSKGGIVDEQGLIYANEDTNSEKFGFYNGSLEIAVAKDMQLINVYRIRKYISLEDLHWLIKEAAELPEDWIIKQPGDIAFEDNSTDNKVNVATDSNGKVATDTELTYSSASTVVGSINKVIQQNLNELHKEIVEIKNSIKLNNKQNLEIEHKLSHLQEHLLRLKISDVKD